MRTLSETLIVNQWQACANLEDRQIGDWRITHTVHEPGHYPMHRTLGYDFVNVKRTGRITQLQERRGQWRDWMTDDPLFFYAMQEYAEQARGPAMLVGGLGLGLVLRHLSTRQDIGLVYVIERQQEVIDMVWDQLDLDGRFKLVHQDFFEFDTGMFDTVLTDFWVGTPADANVQRLFLKTFEHVNTHWTQAKQFYHGLQPWHRLMQPFWDSGGYQELRLEQKLGLLQMLP